MTIFQWISVVRSDTVIHIISGDDTLFFGTVREMYEKVSDDTLRNNKVIDAYMGFGGLCIEVAPV